MTQNLFIINRRVHLLHVVIVNNFIIQSDHLLYITFNVLGFRFSRYPVNVQLKSFHLLHVFTFFGALEPTSTYCFECTFLSGL